MKKIIPPDKWKRPVVILIGMIVGCTIYLVYVSNAVSYMSDNPKVCVNCHIMAPQYATWAHSLHRETANCSDCHVPHDNIFNKYFFKAKDGIRHAAMFTLKLEPQVIHIHQEGEEVFKNNCIRCHSNQIHNTKVESVLKNHVQHIDNRKCWECHRETPHGRVKSLSSAPFARIPLPESPVPEWLKEIMNEE